MNELLVINKGEYAPYYDGYVQQVSRLPILTLLETQIQEMRLLFDALGPKSTESYASGKWTAKEVLGHMIDTDRIMTFRALCFARNDKNAMPGFDQDEYISSATFNEIPLEDLLADFENQRKALLSLIKTLTPEAWLRKGIANNYEVTVRALIVIIAGHTAHHMQILRERYM
jgi:hypothetical protein